jgi:transposase InsO family protein
VLAWGLSNTLDVSFCIEAFHEAVRVAGRAPDIFNTDQGCQFTCRAWIETLEAAGVRVSMDGRGRWMDNVFIERLWRAVKHEGGYLWAHTDLVELELALEKWFTSYNLWKPHRSLEMLTHGMPTARNTPNHGRWQHEESKQYPPLPGVRSVRCRPPPFRSATEAPAVIGTRG